MLPILSLFHRQFTALLTIICKKGLKWQDGLTVFDVMAGIILQGVPELTSDCDL